MKDIFKTNEVFGVSNDSIKTYVEREKVDDLFVDGLSRNKHIIVYGASKQGKTSLTTKHLKPDDFVRVNCSHNSSSADLYKSVVRQLGIEFEESRESTITAGGEPKIGLKVNVKVPVIGGAEASGELGGKIGVETKKTIKTVEYNFELAQDIAELLKEIKFKKRIVLENFHYLSENTQKRLAFDLRVFEDYNILFIVLGIWRERNRLPQFNGDLLDRLIEIPVEPWEKDDLRRIIKEGEPLLNVSFNKVADRLIETCFDSVGVFQELCKESCLAAGVLETSENIIEILDTHLNEAITKKLGDYSSRHIRSLEAFVQQEAKSSDETPLYIRYYFIKVLFEAPFDKIVQGFRRKELQERIKAIHHRPQDVRASDMGYFVKTLVSNQIKNDISPPIFDYDQSTSSIKIIDSTFYFFLRNCDKKGILGDLPLPPGIE